MPRLALRVVQATVTVLLLTMMTAAQSGAGQQPDRAAAGEEASRSRPAADPVRLPTGQWFRAIRDVQADITVPPEEATPLDRSDQLFSAVVDGPSAYRQQWPACCFMWVPTDLCYWPLYFEDVRLERYGQTLAPRFQPLLSGAHFCASFACYR